jgi:DNA-binding response OmpR family regulator
MKLFGKWRKEEVPVKEEPAFVGEPTPSAKTVTEAIGKNRKILIVDDNSVVLKAFDLKLKANGFEVLTAVDGAAGVSLARSAKPDVIVLDVNFPPDVGTSGLQWDGFNIMTWLRRFEEVANIPIIIISSGDQGMYQQKSISSGAVAFFQKPINYEEFMVAVRKAIGRADATASGAVA